MLQKTAVENGPSAVKKKSGQDQNNSVHSSNDFADQDFSSGDGGLDQLNSSWDNGGNDHGNGDYDDSGDGDVRGRKCRNITIRRYAPGVERFPAYIIRQHHDEVTNFINDITSDEPAMSPNTEFILKYYLLHAGYTINTMVVSERLEINAFFVRTCCKILNAFGILDEEPALSNKFKVRDGFLDTPAWPIVAKVLGISPEQQEQIKNQFKASQLKA